MRVLLLSVATALAFTGSAYAQSSELVTVKPAVAKPAGSKKGPSGRRDAVTGDPNRRVCRAEVATGSRLGGAKVCRSAREWEERRQAAKAELDRHQRPDGTNF